MCIYNREINGNVEENLAQPTKYQCARQEILLRDRSGLDYRTGARMITRDLSGATKTK